MTDIDKIIEEEAQKVMTEGISLSEIHPNHDENFALQNSMREKLIKIVVSGQSKEFLGKNFTSDEIEKLDQKEIEKLYARYESRIGVLVTKTLKKHIISAYSNAVMYLLPGNFVLTNPEELEESLEKAPFVNLALSSWSSTVYHTFGKWLAPLEALLLTSNHLQQVNQDFATQNHPDSKKEVTIDEIE